MNRILTRGCYTVPDQRLCGPDDDAAVVPTEAEAVGDRRRGHPWPGLVENDIDAEFRIDVFRAGGWRDQAMLDRQQQCDGLQPAGRAESMTSDAFGRGHRYTSGAEDLGDCRSLGGVVEWRRRAVGVDMADVRGLQIGVGERQPHAGDRAHDAGSRRGDVMRIGIAGGTHDLADDGGATPFSHRPFLEHQDPGSFAEHEAVAVDVERTAGPRGRQGGHVAETGDTDGAPGGFGSAGDDCIAHAPRNQPGRVANRMSGGGARGGDRLVRTAQSVAHRDGRPGRIGHHHRHREGRNTAFSLGQHVRDLLLGGSETTDTGREDRAEAVGCHMGSAGLLERFCGSGQRELLDAIGTSSVLRIVEVGKWIPVLDLDAARIGDSGTVETVPECLLTDPTRCDDAVTGDRYAPPGAFHQSLPTTRSYAWPTVSMPSRSSSGTSTPNCSSNAMTSSTRSRLSASRSSPNLASGTTLSSGTESTSTAHFWKRANIA